MKPVQKVRLKDKRRRASYLTYAVYGVVTLALLGAIAYVTRLPAVTIATVQIVGAANVDSAAVQSLVEKKLDGTYLLLVPKRLAFVVPSGTLRAAILDAFPAVQSVEVARVSLTALEVRVTERQPFALWCSASCFHIDEYGYAFETAKPTDTLRTFVGDDAALGKTFMDGSFHDFERLVSDSARIAGTAIQRVRVASPDAFLELTHGGEIRIVRTADPAKVRTVLTALYSSAEFAKAKKLDYIELRFGDKAVVKFAD